MKRSIFLLTPNNQKVSMRINTLVHILILIGFTMNGLAQEKRTVMEPIKDIKYTFKGAIGDRIDANVENWLIRMPEDNPGLLEMFARRDSTPPLHLLPWSGEFVGKYLISGVMALQMSDDPRLEKTLKQVVQGLIDLQTEDGYMGPFPRDQRLIGHCYWDPDGEHGHWDLWGHYNVMYGLLLWNKQVSDERALQAVVKAADLICNIFIDADKSIVDAGHTDQNGAIVHVLLLLYRKTGDNRYLKQAEQILTNYKAAGEFVEKALQGVDYYLIRGGRWESLHILQALAEYYLITGDIKYKKAFTASWQSINRTDVHNTGAFSTHERAVDNPYEEGAIETCCTVAWIHMTIDALRLTGDPKIADALEQSLFNAMAGSQHPSGEWWTYMTPMDGRKLPSYVSINFQSRATTPELNCCSVNGPRSLGCLSNWAIMQADSATVVNYYGPMKATFTLASGNPVRLIMETEYPVHGKVNLYIEGADGESVPLCLRIPGWSKKTSIKVNDEIPENIPAGTYYKITRIWNDGDRITLDFEMFVRYIEGDGRLKDHVSIYRGPILLAVDTRFNPDISESHPPHGWVPPWTEAMPLIDKEKISEARLLPQTAREYGAGLYRPWVLVSMSATDNMEIILCDFATAGFPGTSYRTWLETVH